MFNKEKSICFLIILTLLLSYNLYAQIKVGFEPPDFILYDSNGAKIDTLQYQGKIPVVISFFATFCMPCKKEIPFLLEKSENQKKFKLILVVTDTSDKKKLAAFFSSMRVTHPYIYDQGGMLSQRYKTQELPFTIFIGKSGKIVAVEKGFNQSNHVLYNEVINSFGDM